MKVVYGPLENEAWAAVNNSSVNQVPADAIWPQKLPDGSLEVVMVASKPYGGALVHCTQPTPVLPDTALPYVGLDLEFFLSEAAVAFLRCLEIDLKVSMLPAPPNGVIANVCDFSSQIELFNGGNLQIDNQAGTWTDAGSAFGALPVGVWVPWSSRYLIDAPNSKYSVLSVAVAGVAKKIAAALQGLGYQKTNWAANSETQFQLDNNTVPAAMAVQYRNIYQTYSDQPF